MTDSGSTRARTAEELLDREAGLARRQLLSATRQFADEACEAADLRGRIRRHPFGAMALGLTLGALGGPALVRRARASRLPAVALASLVRFATRR